ncbi:hypothetical protein Ancab_038357 [Ancistrocladus abbreviatus]
MHDVKTTPFHVWISAVIFGPPSLSPSWAGPKRPRAHNYDYLRAVCFVNSTNHGGSHPRDQKNNPPIAQLSHPRHWDRRRTLSHAPLLHSWRQEHLAPSLARNSRLPHHRLQIRPYALLIIISSKARQSQSLAVHLRRPDRDTQWSRRLLLRVLGEARAHVMLAYTRYSIVILLYCIAAGHCSL